MSQVRISIYVASQDEEAARDAIAGALREVALSYDLTVEPVKANTDGPNDLAAACHHLAQAVLAMYFPDLPAWQDLSGEERAGWLKSVEWLSERPHASVEQFVAWCAGRVGSLPAALTGEEIDALGRALKTVYYRVRSSKGMGGNPTNAVKEEDHAG